MQTESLEGLQRSSGWSCLPEGWGVVRADTTWGRPGREQGGDAGAEG